MRGGAEAEEEEDYEGGAEVEEEEDDLGGAEAEEEEDDEGGAEAEEEGEPGTDSGSDLAEHVKSLREASSVVRAAIRLQLRAIKGAAKKS